MKKDDHSGKKVPLKAHHRRVKSRTEYGVYENFTDYIRDNLEKGQFG
jgi:deferrochelatase/peroxidase EfeB